MSKKLTVALLFTILIIASFLRLWKLGQVPPSPDWDEAALGYNAYSIMQTGKDEYGKFLPVVLRSFDDYKPAFYAYFAIPSIKIFGLNIFAVRLPSTIFGVLTVFATFFLVKRLFEKWEIDREAESEEKNPTPDFSNLTTCIALLASFLLAISPWHIQFSRIAFESNVGMAFNVFAIIFLLKGLRNVKFFLLASVIVGVNFYIYQSEKVFGPLLLFSFILIFKNKLLVLPKKYLAIAVLLLAIVALPMVSFIISNKEALARAQGVSVFSDKTPFLKENVQKLADDRANNDFLGLILDNRRIVYIKSIVSGYISHFDLNWLFIKGDITRHHAPGMGLLYIWELPFLLIGIYSLFFKNFNRKIKLFIFSWFLITPIPASITTGVPHAVRTLNFLPIFQILIAIGIVFFITSISKVKYQKFAFLARFDWRRAGGLNMQIKYLIFSLSFLFFIFNLLYYLNQYFVQQNYFNSYDWQYGYKETVSEMEKIGGNYQKIIVSNKPHMDQSYIFFLFYLNYPPLNYQNEANNASGGFRENHYFGKYEFRPIDWQEEEKNKKILFIGRPNDFPEGAKVIKTINFLDSKPAIKIVEG